MEGRPEGGFQIEEVFTREEALRVMAIWVAYSRFEENQKGNIEAGKFSDFMIYSQDLMSIPVSETPNTMAKKSL